MKELGSVDGNVYLHGDVAIGLNSYCLACSLSGQETGVACALLTDGASLQRFTCAGHFQIISMSESAIGPVLGAEGQLQEQSC